MRKGLQKWKEKLFQITKDCSGRKWRMEQEICIDQQSVLGEFEKIFSIELIWKYVVLEYNQISKNWKNIDPIRDDVLEFISIHPK